LIPLLVIISLIKENKCFNIDMIRKVELIIKIFLMLLLRPHVSKI
jgi:hypothetical protein